MKILHNWLEMPFRAFQNHAVFQGSVALKPLGRLPQKMAENSSVTSRKF